MNNVTVTVLNPEHRTNITKCRICNKNKIHKGNKSGCCRHCFLKWYNKERSPIIGLPIIEQLKNFKGKKGSKNGRHYYPNCTALFKCEYKDKKAFGKNNTIITRCKLEDMCNQQNDSHIVT